jgi:histidinol phosphatase-like PHP family hydrolase
MMLDFNNGFPETIAQLQKFIKTEQIVHLNGYILTCKQYFDKAVEIINLLLKQNKYTGSCTNDMSTC